MTIFIFLNINSKFFSLIYLENKVIISFIFTFFEIYKYILFSTTLNEKYFKIKFIQNYFNLRLIERINF